MGHFLPCCCVWSLKDGKGACHTRENPPQAAVRTLTGRRLRFQEPSRFGDGHYRDGCERGAGSNTWWQRRAGAAAAAAPAVEAVGPPEEPLALCYHRVEELIWAGWTQQSQRKSASALTMARFPQANPLMERPGIRGWTKFLMRRLNFLFSLQACRGTIRCLVILFPSNRKVLATPHS